jgi:hypothetical protein
VHFAERIAGCGSSAIRSLVGASAPFILITLEIFEPDQSGTLPASAITGPLLGYEICV